MRVAFPALAAMLLCVGPALGQPHAVSGVELQDLKKDMEGLKALLLFRQGAIEMQHRSLAVQAADVSSALEQVQMQSVTMGAVLREGIWLTSSVAVCWEDGIQSHALERQLVREAISASWESKSAIRFTGWDACSTDSRGIRIRWSDVGPHAKGLGSQIDGLVDGMVLNSTFQHWSPSCQQPANWAVCVKGIAVHEFGHALGFAHEQNRDDTPEECRGEVQGTDPDWYLTIFDKSSVMYYCNPRWVDGILSPLDVDAVQKLYGI